MDTLYVDDKKQEYLLVNNFPKKKFFNNIGYNLSNWNELKEQILKRSLFANSTIRKQNKYGIEISGLAKVYDKVKDEDKIIIVGWSVEPSGKLSFVTAYPYHGKKGQ